MSEYIVVHSVKVATEFVPETFGRLTTAGPRFLLPRKCTAKRRAFQVCQCSCGSFSCVNVTHLKNGHSKSCGCHHREVATQTGKNSVRHGKSHLREYNIYHKMLARCTDQTLAEYENYGGRGITVCDRWLEPDDQGLLNFLSDMGPRPTNKHEIERKHVNGNYCPENCVWATRLVQARNKRNSLVLTFNGKTQCVSAWAEEAITAYENPTKSKEIG